MGKIKHDDLQLGCEYPPEDEMQYVSEMIADMEAQVDRLYEKGEMLRQAHPKMHGLVDAEFIIDSNLPDDLKVGIFKEPKTFKAHIRMSSANSSPQSDKKGDVRGFAIKLYDVPGEKLLTDQSTHQDLLLISYDQFMARNVKQFSKTIKALTTGKMSLLLYLINPLHWGVLARTLKSVKKQTQLLNTSFWSTTPYQFGSLDKAVKYYVSPANAEPFESPSTKSDNLLRENLVHALDSRDAYFDFHIQFQTDANKMPIEDPTVVWDSPFIKVATLKIPKQKFDTDEINQMGEELHYSPWHAVAAHRPLGGLNRARKVIYESMYGYRAQHNNFN